MCFPHQGFSLTLTLTLTRPASTVEWVILLMRGSSLSSDLWKETKLETSGQELQNWPADRWSASSAAQTEQLELLRGVDPAGLQLLVEIQLPSVCWRQNPAFLALTFPMGATEHANVSGDLFFSVDSGERGAFLPSLGLGPWATRPSTYFYLISVLTFVLSGASGDL